MGFFDKIKNTSIHLQSCPECGEDELKGGLVKEEVACESCGYETTFSKTRKFSTDELDYSIEDAENTMKNMRHEINPEDLLEKKLTKVPLDYLDEDETLYYFLRGFDFDIDDNDEGFDSQLLVTDKKLVMLASSITGKDSQYIVSYPDIIGVSVQRRIMSQIRIQTAGHSYKISAGGSSPELADDVAEFIRKRKEEIDTEGQDSAEDSALDKLERLSDLRNKGAISESEFNEKKQKLMEDI